MIGGLYQSIKQLFSQRVLLFENALSSLDSDADGHLLTALYEQCQCPLPRAPRLVPRGLFDVAPPLPSLKGKCCQVIVRIREIQLTLERPTVDENDWTDHGTETGQIIATGIVFYSVTNLTQPRLAIRTDVEFPLHMPVDNVTLGFTYGLANQDQDEQELGHTTAMEGR